MIVAAYALRMVQLYDLNFITLHFNSSNHYSVTLRAAVTFAASMIDAIDQCIYHEM